MGNRRYERQKEIKDSKNRHGEVVEKLTRNINNIFEHERIDLVPKCRDTVEEPWGKYNPSPWTDWSSKPEDREDYEYAPPTADQARALCSGCPLMKNDLCLQYAEMNGEKHGVWGGVRIEKGRRLRG